jgi:hypothetical protein
MMMPDGGAMRPPMTGPGIQISRITGDIDQQLRYALMPDYKNLGHHLGYDHEGKNNDDVQATEAIGTSKR